MWTLVRVLAVESSDNSESLANGYQLGGYGGAAWLQNHAFIDDLDVRGGVDRHRHCKGLRPLVFEVVSFLIGGTELPLQRAPGNHPRCSKDMEPVSQP